MLRWLDIALTDNGLRRVAAYESAFFIEMIARECMILYFALTGELPLKSTRTFLEVNTHEFGGIQRKLRKRIHANLKEQCGFVEVVKKVNAIDKKLPKKAKKKKGAIEAAGSSDSDSGSV